MEPDRFFEPGCLVLPWIAVSVGVALFVGVYPRSPLGFLLIAAGGLPVAVLASMFFRRLDRWLARGRPAGDHSNDSAPKGVPGLRFALVLLSLVVAYVLGTVAVRRTPWLAEFLRVHFGTLWG